jgi:hypothetical protein
LGDFFTRASGHPVQELPLFISVTRWGEIFTIWELISQRLSVVPVLSNIHPFEKKLFSMQKLIKF